VLATKFNRINYIHTKYTNMKSSRILLQKIIVLTAIILAIGVGCKRTEIPIEESATTNIPTTTTDGVDVYLAGIQFDATGKAVATVWKNGIATSLSNSSNPQTVANSVFVFGADVFVGGTVFDTTTGNNIATIWKNGVPTTLGNGNGYSLVNSVFSYGTDVYASGWERISGGVKKATVWKNGVATTLGNGNDGNARSVFVTGTDVYAVGEVKTASGTSDTAKIWKNGVATNLTNGRTLAYANSIFIYGTDIYVAGMEININQSPTGGFAKVWKNGAATNLTNGTGASYSNHVFLNLGKGTAEYNVYVIGVESIAGVAKARVWKNGLIATNLINENIGNRATSAFVLNNDVYVTEISGASSTLNTKVWKNGELTPMLLGKTRVFINSIFVK
jgi:hypothetical protein